MTAIVAGADGCRRGWLCVLRQVDPPFSEQAFIAKTIGGVLSHPSAPAVIAIDIPIGFPDRIVGPGRKCDAAARKGLGKRASAVFSAPARPVLAEANYPRACGAALAAYNPPRKISKQMFHLFPKIREADAAVTPALQERIFECHPEVSFWAMNGRAPLDRPKKRLAGRDERRALLLTQGYSGDFLRGEAFRRTEAGIDDFLDACACAWTAARIFRGEAIRFPKAPLLDAKGLRMEILA
jgi:predicted RNase H-like nuclease